MTNRRTLKSAGLAALLLVAGAAVPACATDQAEFDSADGVSDGDQGAPGLANPDAGGDAEASDEEATESADQGGDTEFVALEEIAPERTDVVGEVTTTIEVDNYNASAAGTVTYGVHSVEIIDNTMTVELYITADYDTGQVDEHWDYIDSNEWTLLPTVVDRANLVEYSLLEFSYHNWDSDTVFVPLDNGVTSRWIGNYPAPSGDPSSVDVVISDELPPIKVPLS